MSTALTLTPYRRCTPERNRSIPTISAGFLGGRLGNVSAVDTSPRRSESGVLAARPGASVTGPSPLSPARRLRRGPEAMTRRRSRPELARVGPSRPAPRGSGSTGQGLCVLHEGPTYPKCTRPSSSSTPPSCSTSGRRRQPPERPGQSAPTSRNSSSPIWQTHTQAVS